MTSYAKPVPAPRGIPTSQGVDGSFVSTQQMESEETDGRPKPPIRPKPKVLPKPLTKIPSLDAGLPLPSSMPWSPKSPISEVPSAEKINLLTGPKPYGAGSSGVFIRRPSLTFKRQTSESFPVDEVCSSSVAPESKAAAPLPPSVSLSSGTLAHDMPSLAMQTEVDSVRREPVRQEPTMANTNAKDARPPVMKKPTMSFHVKPVLGAPKPGRFPGTTVEQILAKMEEDKSTGVAPGTDRSWPQRSSLSFDGYRFGSTAYSSFHRSASTTESPPEIEEEPGSKEVGSSSPAAAPASPLFQGYPAWSATKQGHGAAEAARPQESALSSDKSPERRTDFVSTVTNRLKEADSRTMTPEVTYSRGAETSSLWSKAPEYVPETQSSPLIQEASRVHLEEEPPSSFLLSQKPLVSTESSPVIEKDTRAHVEQKLPSTLSAVGEIHGTANAPVSSRTSLEKELVSSLLLGGAPLVPSFLESPAVDRVSPKETEAIEVATPLKVNHSLPSDPPLVESSHRKVITDTPAMSERSMGVMDWSLSESFEWSSPAKSSEWSKMSTNPPPSRHEESIDQRPSGNTGGMSDDCTDSNVLVGTAQGIYSPHRLIRGGSQEHSEVEMGVEMDQTKSGPTTTPELKFSSQNTLLQEYPSNIEACETSYETEEAPRWERRHYSREQTEPLALGGSQREESISTTTLEMLKKKDEHTGGLADAGLLSGTYVAHGSYPSHRSSEETQEEAGGERPRIATFHAQEVFEPHTVTTKVLQVETEPHLDNLAGLAGARELMEPVRPILLSDPAAEPCVLYHGLGPLEHATPSREDDSFLAKLEDRREHTECTPSYAHEIEAPQSLSHAPDEGSTHTFMVSAGQTSEVSDFDPIRRDLATKKGLDAGGSNAQWLEELLSPTTGGEGTEQEREEAKKSAESENGLLGWSQKDLQSEFGSGVSAQIGHSKSVWDDQYGFGGTNQSQELDLGNNDWSRKHRIEGSSWRKESELPNTDWSVKHNTGDMSQSGESGMSHMDWSVTHSMEAGTEGEDPDGGRRDWSLKHSEEDEGAEAGVIGGDYSIKHDMEYTLHTEESEVRPRDWSISHSMEERMLSKEPEIGHRESLGEKCESEQAGFSNRDWSVKHGVEGGDHSREPGVSNRDWSVKHGVEGGDHSREPGVIGRDWSLKHGVQGGDHSREPGVIGRDWSVKHGVEGGDHSREPGIIGRDWSLEHGVEGGDHSREPGIIGRDWSLKHGVEGGDHSREPGIIGRDWSLKHGIGDGAQSEEGEILTKDGSISHIVGDTYPLKEPEIGIGGLSITQSMGEKAPGYEPGVIGRDWSISHNLVDSGQDREFKISGRNLLSNEEKTDGSREQNIGETGISEDFAARSKEWNIGQHTELDAQCRILGEAHAVTVMDQFSEDGVGSTTSRIHGEELEMETEEDQDQMGRLREIGHGGFERRGEHEAERSMPAHGVEREMGDGEVERTYTSSAEAVERMLDGQMHRNDMPYGGSPEPGDEQNIRCSKDLSVGPHETLQPEIPSTSLLDDILGRGASRQSPRNERPASLQSSHSQESEDQSMDYTSPSLTEVDSPRKSMEVVSPIQSHADVKHEQSQSDEDKAVARSMLMEEEGEAAEAMEETRVSQVDFSFLEETEVLDCSVHRTRASLSRKRGHRVPTARPGAAVNSTECDGDDWMFQDSTEPKVPRPDSSDDETAMAEVVQKVEEQPQKSSKKSPVSQGKKLGLFAGFNPMALKAKLKSRKSAEEGEQPKSPRQKDNFQRSKSCKLPAESGKPPVLPPKPEKASGSESSTPQWLSALKIKKKPPK